MKVTVPAFRHPLVRSISNRRLGCSDYQTAVLPVCPSDIHGRRTGLRTERFDLLVWEGSCGRMELRKALTAGCKTGSTGEKAAVVAAIEGSMGAVAAIVGAVEVCNSRWEP